MPYFIIDQPLSTASGMTVASNKRARGSGPGSDGETTEDDHRKPATKRMHVKIPRPPGEAGRKDGHGFVMVEALGLTDNRRKYLAILVGCTDAIPQISLTCSIILVIPPRLCDFSTASK